MPLLVPGYGSQGRPARDVAGAFDDDGFGAIVNNSRGITFAYQRPASTPGSATTGKPRSSRPSTT